LEISDALIRGETVKISSFGSFSVRQKGQRVGRNPKTGEEVPILPRKVLVFRASHVLKGWVDDVSRQAEEDATGAPMSGNVTEPAAGPIGGGSGRGGDGGTF
jgi:hypothetical protein